MENLCTPTEQARIAAAAQARVHFLAWLARALLRTDDLLIRKEASQAILQLIGGKHE